MSNYPYSPTSILKNKSDLDKEFKFDLDSRLVVRCNSEMKISFEDLCARFGRTPSTVIRDYILHSIKNGRI